MEQDKNGFYQCPGCGKFVGHWTAIHDVKDIHTTIDYEHYTIDEYHNILSEISCPGGLGIIGFDFIEELRNI